jgi:hypothetical protein
MDSVLSVFISSTAEDLESYRAAGRDAAPRGSFLPLLHEYWVARDNPPFDECIQRVKDADVLVVIVAERDGWVPEDQPSGGRKSITWLECEQAAGKGIEVLAFVLDESVGDRSEHQQEEFELTRAMKESRATAELFADVNARVQGLKDFKAWLNARAIRSTFTSPEDLRGKVESALRAWRDRHPEVGEAAPPDKDQQADPTKYLQDLRADCAAISIRGLAVGTGKAHSSRPTSATSSRASPGTVRAVRIKPGRQGPDSDC